MLSSSSEGDSASQESAQESQVNDITTLKTKWSLLRQPGGPRGGDDYFLMVNGDRAQSKRTGEDFGRLATMSRNGPLMEFTTREGKRVKLRVDDADLNALSQEVSQDIDVEDLEQTLQPLFESTPATRVTQRRNKRSGKRARETVQNPDIKFKGICEVPLAALKKAAEGSVLIKGSHERTEGYKRAIIAGRGVQQPVLPVLVEGREGWEKENGDNYRYTLLAGYSLWQAMMDLASDEKYRHYNRILVKVYEGLTPMEVIQVGGIFQQEHQLLMDEAPTLEDKVDLCRRLLYAMHEVDEAEEPPTRVSPDWRVQAAAALGVVSSKRKELHGLETVFQMALYSKRCYDRLKRVFGWYEHKFTKPMKQTIFVKLQGLSEEDKYSLLGKVLTGQLELADVRVEAARLKTLSAIQRAFSALIPMPWDECQEEYPVHTQEASLRPFLEMDFRASVPQEFVEFVREAKLAKERGNSSLEDLRASPVALAILEVDSKKGMKRVIKNMKEGSQHVAVIAEAIELAGAWQVEMRREGLKIQRESVVLKDDHACHLIIASAEDVQHTFPRLVDSADVFSKLIDIFSMDGERIGIGVADKDVFDLVRSKGRIGVRMQGGSCFSVISSEEMIEDGQDTYLFSDSETLL